MHVTDDDPAADPGATVSDWERRRRRAAIFGDSLPEVTNDEREPGEGRDAGRESATDRWLRSQVPPHHG